MCSEGILTLNELFTASIDEYIYFRAYLVSGSQLQTWSFSYLVRFVPKKKERKKKRLSNKTDHSSFLTILRFFFLLFFYNFANIP